MMPKDIIQIPLNVDSEAIMQKLRSLKINQSQMFEESFKNYQQMSIQIKNQNDLKKPSTEYQYKEIQEKQFEEQSKSIEQEIFLQKERIQQLDQVLQLRSRENKNLQEESTEKQKLYQDYMDSKYTDLQQMPFSRITLPRQVQQYQYIQDQDILIQCEKDDPIPSLKIQNIEKRQVTTSIYSNSVSQSFACFSVLLDKLIWCTENSTEVELWTFNKPPEPLHRLGILQAHNDSITILQFLTPKVFISSSQKNILKLWNIETQQLLKSFRLTSQITYCQLLNQRVITKQNQKIQNNDAIQIIAGFSNGLIRILEFSGINSQQSDSMKFDVIYEVSLNEKSHKYPVIDCISVAFPFDSKQEISKHVPIDQVLIASSLVPEPDNIYIVVPEKQGIYSIHNTKKVYRNSSNKKQFTLTQEYLIAGSFDGQIYVWDISNLTHILKPQEQPQLPLKFSSTTLSTVPILISSYDQRKDTLILGDQQGNILKWEKFIQQIIKK